MALKLYQVDIDSTTVEVLNYKLHKTLGNKVSMLTVKVKRDTTASLITEFNTIELYEGYTTATDRREFYGFIVDIEQTIDGYVLTCYNELYKAVMATINEHYTLTGAQGGQVSEIFKDILDTIGLSYTTSTIQDSGNTLLIKDYLLRDADAMERLDELAKRLNWQWYYDDSTRLVYLEPKANRVNENTIYIGGANNNVTGQPKWNLQGKDIINKVIVKGVYDRVTEPAVTFSGDGSTTEFTLDVVPDDVSVSLSGVEQSIGKEDVLDDVDVLLDAANKKLTFTTAPPSGTDNISVVVHRLIETPVEITDETAVTDLNNLTSSTTITVTDVPSIQDAELIGQKVLEARKKCRASTVVTIKPSQVESIDPQIGQKIEVQDSINTGRNGEYLITDVFSDQPDKGATIRIQNPEANIPDMDLSNLIRIKRLEERFETQDVIVNVIKATENLFQPTTQYSYIQEYINDSFTVDHEHNSLLDQGTILDVMNSSSANWTASAPFTVSDNNKDAFIQVQTGSMKLEWSSTGTGTLTNTTSLGDISDYTGAASGTPTKGTFGLWIWVSTANDVTAITLRIGSSATDYIETSAISFAGAQTYSGETFTLQQGWNYIMFRNSLGTVTGTPDWTAVDYTRLEITTADDKIAYLDYFTVSKSNVIGLNGVGKRYTVKTGETSEAATGSENSNFPWSFPIRFG